jgi:hypothetical protein
MDLTRTVVELGSSTGYLVLPRQSDDPIVQGYLNSCNANDYMLTALAESTVRGDMLLDVGRHAGFSSGAAPLGQKVLSVEANPLHFDLVRKSHAVNSLRQSSLKKQISSSPIQ